MQIGHVLDVVHDVGADLHDDVVGIVAGEDEALILRVDLAPVHRGVDDLAVEAILRLGVAEEDRVVDHVAVFAFGIQLAVGPRQRVLRGGKNAEFEAVHVGIRQTVGQRGIGRRGGFAGGGGGIGGRCAAAAGCEA